MQIMFLVFLIFIISPMLLLPVLRAWLARPNHAKAPATPSAVSAPAQKAARHTPVYCKEAQRAYRDMLELAAEQRHRESPAYRKAAQAAYREMQQMHEEDAGDAGDSKDMLPPPTARCKQAPACRTSAHLSPTGTFRNPLIRLG